MSIYWLVTDDRKGPLALIKSIKGKAQLVAGSDHALKSFVDGKPDLLINEPWYFEPISGRSCFPAIGEWIDKLGPPQSASTRLKKEREVEKRRERAKNLTPQEISKMRELRGNGVVIRRIAEKFQVTETIVRKHVSGTSIKKTGEPEHTYRVPVRNELEVA